MMMMMISKHLHDIQETNGMLERSGACVLRILKSFPGEFHLLAATQLVMKAASHCLFVILRPSLRRQKARCVIDRIRAIK